MEVFLQIGARSFFVVFLPVAVDLHNYCRDKDFVNSYGVLLIFSS